MEAFSEVQEEMSKEITVDIIKKYDSCILDEFKSGEIGLKQNYIVNIPPSVHDKIL
jgi:hypothetical protein